MKHSFLRHTTAFLLSIVIAMGLLLAGACLPQEPIDANVVSSAQGMIQDGPYPMVADKSYASMLDYVTDALILAHSKATTISQWETILTNPQYEYGEGTKVDHLYHYSLDEDPQPTGYYSRYWMGFRSYIRLALCFFDYYQILRYVAVAFFVLLAATMCSVAKHTGTKTAFLFALSIILVRPHVVAVSLQFSCCFFLAFLAMLLVPWIYKKPEWESLFFLELGIATMYFDFYTTPILTFGLPMTYLCVLRHTRGATTSLKNVGRNTLSWFGGYVGMWLAKLCLTSALTSDDGIGAGMRSLMERIGVTKASGMESYYNPLTALRTVAASLYSDREGKLVLLALCALLFLLVLAVFLRRKPSFRSLLTHSALLLIAFLPLLWFMIAAQPTANHHWFQYRGIAVTFWAGLVYLQLTLQKKPDAPLSAG